MSNAVKNPDGTNTIKAGQQTPEANALNRKICDSFGAKDVTNEIDITMGSGTPHAGICVGPIGNRPSSSVQTVSEFQNSTTWSAASGEIEIPPCISKSTIPAEPANRNFDGYASCTSPLINATYTACYGKNCTIIQEINSH